ncbi:hypothetical protein JZU46_02950 [bacterium]|nr:hypothetical protein [bacterium]
MTKTFTALIKLHNDLLAEVESELAALGGKVKVFSPEDSTIDIDIDPDLQTYAEEYLSDVIIRFNNARKKILIQDPFIGVKLLLFSRKDGVDT